MPENWRCKQGFAYSYEVRCGGCLRWVHEMYADSREAGLAERGRCRECVAASPIVVEAEPERVRVVEGEAEEEGVPEGNLCPDCGALLSQYGCPVCGEENAPAVEEAAEAVAEEDKGAETVVGVDPDSEIPGVVETSAESEKEDEVPAEAEATPGEPAEEAAQES